MALHHSFAKEGHYREVYKRRCDRVLEALRMDFTPRDLRAAARKTQHNDVLFYDDKRKLYWYWGDN